MSHPLRTHWGLDALNGLRVAWHDEFNFRFHVLSTVTVLAAGWYLDLTKSEWVAVIIVIGIVLTAESFNTALEEFCDMVKSDPDPHIGKIKDLAAAAVLLAAITAAAVGLLIFIPHILDRIFS